jgi:pimeloyl-ACP methyl ester carboxylesterase
VSSATTSRRESGSARCVPPPLLATITARTLIVHGDRDPVYPIELALEMYRSIPSSALWVVPNGGHGRIFGALAWSFVDTAWIFLRGTQRA